MRLCSARDEYIVFVPSEIPRGLASNIGSPSSEDGVLEVGALPDFL